MPPPQTGDLEMLRWSLKGFHPLAELISCLQSLPVYNRSYAVLYVELKLRFPEVATALRIPRPERTATIAAVEFIQRSDPLPAVAPLPPVVPAATPQRAVTIAPSSAASSLVMAASPPATAPESSSPVVSSSTAVTSQPTSSPQPVAVAAFPQSTVIPHPIVSPPVATSPPAAVAPQSAVITQSAVAPPRVSSPAAAQRAAVPAQSTVVSPSGALPSTAASQLIVASAVSAASPSAVSTGSSPATAVSPSAVSSPSVAVSAVSFSATAVSPSAIPPASAVVPQLVAPQPTVTARTVINSNSTQGHFITKREQRGVRLTRRWKQAKLALVRPKWSHFMIGDLLSREKKTGLRTQEARPAAATEAQHTSIASKSSPYPGCEATVELRARFVSHLFACSGVAPPSDASPPVTPKCPLLEPPPEPPPTATPTPASPPPPPPLREAQNNPIASESDPYHGREASVKLCARFVSHLFVCPDVSSPLHRDTPQLPPLELPPEPPPEPVRSAPPRPPPPSSPQPSPPSVSSQDPVTAHKPHNDSPQVSNAPDPPPVNPSMLQDPGTRKDKVTRKIKVVRKPRKTNAADTRNSNSNSNVPDPPSANSSQDPTAACKNATTSKPNVDSSQASNVPDPPPANNPQDLVATSKTTAASTNPEANTLQLRPPTQDPRNSQDEKASTHNTAATYTKTRAATCRSVTKPANADESPAFDTSAALRTSDFSTAPQAQDINITDTVPGVSVTDTTNTDIAAASQVQDAVKATSPDIKTAAATLQAQSTVKAAVNTAASVTVPQAQETVPGNTIPIPQAQAIQHNVPQIRITDTPSTPQVRETASPDTKNAATLQAQSTVKAAANTAHIKTTADIIQLQGLSTTVAPQAQDTIQLQDISATTAPQAQAVRIATPQDTNCPQVRHPQHPQKQSPQQPQKQRSRHRQSLASPRRLRRQHRRRSAASRTNSPLCRRPCTLPLSAPQTFPPTQPLPSLLATQKNPSRRHSLSRRHVRTPQQYESNPAAINADAAPSRYSSSSAQTRRLLRIQACRSIFHPLSAAVDRGRSRFRPPGGCKECPRARPEIGKSRAGPEACERSASGRPQRRSPSQNTRTLAPLSHPKTTTFAPTFFPDMPSTQKFTRFDPLFIPLSTLSASVSPAPQDTARSPTSVRRVVNPKTPSSSTASRPSTQSLVSADAHRYPVSSP